jgi:hypothetical protein
MRHARHNLRPTKGRAIAAIDATAVAMARRAAHPGSATERFVVTLNTCDGEEF